MTVVVPEAVEVRMRAVLALYDAAVETWTSVNESAEADGQAPSVRDCERYSEQLEQVAEAFAALARQVLTA